MTPPLRLAPESPGILRFHGPDTPRYLNGQLTQDVGRLGNRTLVSCVTDAKGRLQHFVTVLAGHGDDSIWVTVDPGQCGELHERLSRYLIADDVGIEDISGRWTRVHQSAAEPPADETFRRESRGPWGDGHDLWWPAAAAPNPGSIPADLAESLRVSARIPAWGCELEAGMLPPEAGLDRSAISYQKGCYIGQEVLSRMKTAGRLNRRLAGFIVDPGARPGDSLILGDSAAGHLTSVSPLPGPDGKILALGYLGKRGFDAGTFQIAAADGRTRGEASFTAWA